MNDEYKGTVRRDDSDTPETDAAAWQGHCGDLDWQEVVNADVARRLEREKNTCKYHLEDLQERITNELDQIISLTVENEKLREIIKNFKKMKCKIINKKTYGGMLVDKYFLVLENGDEVQVQLQEFKSYKIGDEYKNPLDEIAKISQENGLYE